MLLTAGEIISKSWDLYKKNINSLLVYMFMLFLPALILKLLGALSLFLTTSLSLYLNASVFLIALIDGIIVLLVFAASFVFAIWAGIALAQSLNKIFLGQPLTDWKTTFAESGRFIWPVIYTSFFVGMIVFGGLLLLIIPGIIFAVWYTFSFYQIVFGNKRGLLAMEESKKMVAGRWWGILWRLAAPALFFTVLGALIASLLGWPFEYFYGANDPSAVVIQTIIGSLVNILISPLTAVAMIILYYSAKETPIQTSAPVSPKI